MDKKKDDALEAEEIIEREDAATAGATEGQDGGDLDLVIRFKKPFVFEGQDYTGVDLSGLEDTTGGRLENVGRQLLKKRPGMNPSTIEMTMDYANLLASSVTGKPVEFFERLPSKEAMKIKSTVVGFLYGGDGED